MMTRTLATIWDMDGTLLDTERLTLRCWKAACADYDLFDVEPVLLKLIGRTARDANAILQKEFGAAFPVDEVRAAKNTLAQTYFSEHGVPVKPGVCTTLQWLRERQIPCAVASSTQRQKVLAHLESTTLAPYFHSITGGDDVQRSKPDPDIFLAAADQLHVHPQNCIVFEDSFSGVTAAHAAGMRVVMVPDLIQPTPEIRAITQHTLQSLEDAIPLLQHYLQ